MNAQALKIKYLFDPVVLSIIYFCSVLVYMIECAVDVELCKWMKLDKLCSIVSRRKWHRNSEWKNGWDVKEWRRSWKKNWGYGYRREANWAESKLLFEFSNGTCVEFVFKNYKLFPALNKTFTNFTKVLKIFKQIQDRKRFKKKNSYRKGFPTFPPEISEFCKVIVIYPL